MSRERRHLACKNTFCTCLRAGCPRCQGATLITIGQASWLEGKRLFFSFLASQDTHAPKALLRAVLHFGACTLKKKGGKDINVPTVPYNYIVARTMKSTPYINIHKDTGHERVIAFLPDMTKLRSSAAEEYVLKTFCMLC